MNTVDREQTRHALETRRQALLSRWKEALAQENELLSEREPDWEDLSALQRDARMLDRIADSEARALGEITAALQRLEEGRYGICEECGVAISPRRLEVRPETELCTECASARPG
ncbi:TraR/DksA family transcriptional regulator [Haliangium sp.]|uniref:TraR/DksA family transcriptional regulator n=1 Tax=Haliangium sp. TaxID=2663208 RepID=UPI003D1141E3